MLQMLALAAVLAQLRWCGLREDTAEAAEGRWLEILSQALGFCD